MLSIGQQLEYNYFTADIMTTKSDPLKWLHPSIKAISVLFIIFMPVLCSTIEVNCSQSNQPALLEALTPVFNLSAIRPVQNDSVPTNISLSFTLYGILGVDEKAQLLITYIWLNYWWMNEFVSWDPVQCGSDRISLPREKFWVPDIVINEFMEENKAPPVPYLYLYNDGRVHDALPVKVVSSCNLDIYTFPFDIQNCTLTFNSYLHYVWDIKIFLRRSADEITEASKTVMTTMGEWELLDINSIKRSFLYDELIFHIRVRRRATLYVVNLLIPSCFLITVDLFSFLLPPQSVDRSSFKMTLILGYTVFLLIMNDLLPVTGNTIPLINVFFSLCLALMVASLLETIFITNLLCGSAEFSPVPSWIQVLVLQILGYLLCLSQGIKEPSNSGTTTTNEGHPEISGSTEEDMVVHELRILGKDLQAIRFQVEKQQQTGSHSSQGWIQVGFIIDRLLFGLYILFISVSFITILIIWQWRNEFVEWDQDECGSWQITVPRKYLWVPDVVINEFMEKNSAPFVPYTYLFSDGKVIDGQPVKVVSSCRLDIYMFPFDIQNCTLSFNSYLHPMAAMHLEVMDSVENIFRNSKDVMTTMGEWELVGITMKEYKLLSADNQLYEEIRFFISVQRRATLYVVNLLMPSCFLMMVDLFSFMLPPKSIDRSLFKMTLILGYTVFLLIMNDLLPITGNTIPLMNVFLSLCLALMVASLLETIVITNFLCGFAHYSPVPHWIRVFILHILGQLVGLPPKPTDCDDTVIQNPVTQETKVSFLVAENNITPGWKGPLRLHKVLQELRGLGSELQAIRLQVEKQQQTGNRSSEEWVQVCYVIDRLLFILYILFISVSFITIIIIWMNSYNTS
ncbi:5-hydroxytryptamine receptor 3E-like [Mugil cephalus]|uniref:5-hydroxytryptamine receptor 3E-like n=1 Tax=Mugil cephalus TaxID=48193 RepID=UPI001FB5A901|nr:5-hydroxytryptamine receptor 3E-like [Mugil cephalus]